LDLHRNFFKYKAKNAGTAIAIASIFNTVIVKICVTIYDIFMVELVFTTKEQSKANQRKAFLRLDLAERFQRFLELMENISWFQVNEKPLANKYTLNKNFIIEKTRDSLEGLPKY